MSDRRQEASFGLGSADDRQATVETFERKVRDRSVDQWYNTRT